MAKEKQCVCVCVCLAGWALNRSLRDTLGEQALSSNPIRQVEKDAPLRFLLPKTNKRRATCCTSTQSTQNLSSRRQGCKLCWWRRRGASIKTNFLKRISCIRAAKTMPAAICKTECPPWRRHFTPLFSVWGMWGILAWPIRLWKKERKEGGLLWRNRGNLWKLSAMARLLSLWCRLHPLCV